MYPANFFALFPPFPIVDKVFVAMSLDLAFEPRWQNVIIPAIKNVEINGTRLEPHRADARIVSDSILTEILAGIRDHRVIFADITSIGSLGTRPVRNGNVMYEVGLAHAVRLPEEVVLFRSDSDSLLFDVTNVRVNNYDPDGAPDTAKAKVRDAIAEAIKEVELRRLLTVRRAIETLDYPSWMLLAEAYGSEGISHPIMRTMGQVLGSTSRANAIARLLELGALKTSYLQATPEMFAKMGEASEENMLKYSVTPFGKAIFDEGIHRMGLMSPEMQAVFEKDASDALAQG